mmetsp:Transcript_13414/g.25764  ORF Transcript_13414/g.25764 Transcript_13414/m.25764 type:complete len:427 (+) Transcript_13414:131-1411(+)
MVVVMGARHGADLDLTLACKPQGRCGIASSHTACQCMWIVFMLILHPKNCDSMEYPISEIQSKPGAVERIDEVQVSVGGLLSRLGLWWEDPAANYACSRILDGDMCINENCVWCATDQQCHAAGSFMNPCTNECCATRSWRSTCRWGSMDAIPQTCTVRARNTTAFDGGRAQELLLHAGAAYCNASAIQDWTCRPCLDPNFVPVEVVLDPDLYLQGYIGTTGSSSASQPEYIVISFRGTIANSLVDWISDLTFKQIAPWPEYPNMLVHEGFYRAYTNSLQAQVLEVLEKLPHLPVYVTGHSLGASIAAICAWDLKMYQGVHVPEIYTYGQPRTGNFNFAITYAKHMHNLWRVVHHFDIVPHIPTTQQNFYHSQREIYYAGNDTTYVECGVSGEDSKCSNQCSKTLACRSISDHLEYMGLPIGSDVC